MMRLPRFRYLAPGSVAEAAAALADLGPEAAVLAGGTDLFPNMKRRQQTPATVVALRGIAALRARAIDPARGLTLGALTRLSAIEHDAGIAAAWPALARAASLVATPPLRNMGTIGGNLCLDTRCSYYDQSHEWRAAIGYCMKKEGETCWVAPSSPRCWAVSSSDTAPVLCALGAEVTLASTAGERRIPASELFADDGIAYLTRRRDEILTSVHVPPPAEGERSAYVKLRRRGSFDFPVLGVAVRARLDAGGTVTSASIFVGGTGSRPQEARAAAELLTGRVLDAAAIREAAGLIAHIAKPMQNTDFTLGWRKAVAREYAARALRELVAGNGAAANHASGS
ncbi:MAG: 4-hydroxybenzoyl-CoA reductase [Deltaproteobacteria bacterium]|nr:MAG: 4-hydroxybenzoyl-CoA reductase [Deltaproteobacteria bacterium]TMQ18036.1 MAG: 4-hydroxybenzoyl-CoA reductase [Deltaproteobacteria bacterium]